MQCNILKNSRRYSQPTHIFQFYVEIPITIFIGYKNVHFPTLKSGQEEGKSTSWPFLNNKFDKS